MNTEPNQPSADVPTLSVVPMTRTRRTRMNLPAKAVVAADSPARKRRKVNPKDVIQGQDSGIDQEKSEQKAGPKRKKRSRKLIELPTMPLDILFEVKLDTICISEFPLKSFLEVDPKPSDAPRPFTASENHKRFPEVAYESVQYICLERCVTEHTWIA